MSDLKLSNVSVKYQDNTALSGVSLELAQGEQHVVLGASGSGKTSLLRVVAGFLPLAQGEIWIRGKKANTSNMTVAPDKRGVGVVFQDYALFSHLNVLDNVAFGLKQNNKATARDWLKKVGLLEKERAEVDELSGGEQQRVALARALAAQPSLILLDEPFSNLDRKLRSELRSLTRETLKQAGQTAIYVTHDPEEAMECGDTVSVLDQGKLIQQGAIEDVYWNPNDLRVAECLGEVAQFDVLGRQGTMVDCGWFNLETLEGQPGDSIMFRPEQLRLIKGGPLQIKDIRFRGLFSEVTCELNGDERVFLTQGENDFFQGDSVGLVVESSLGVLP